ncbi:MAG: hypothetical protein JST19_01930 [Bacteroidetes bacterium]|nr:hypothetical protein [Bacteroidota bacterium]
MDKSFKNILFIAFTLFSLYGCTSAPKPWDNQYTKRLHDSLNNAFKKQLTNEKQRDTLVGCVVEKFKQALPNGLESVPADSSAHLSYKFTGDCVIKIKRVQGSVQWTAKGEEGLRKDFLSGLSTKIPLDARNKLCDCFIAKLKIRYPQRIQLPFPDSVINTAALECANEIKKSK